MHDKIRKIINESRSPTERRMGVIEKLHRKNKKLNKELIATKTEHQENFNKRVKEYDAKFNKLQNEYDEVKRLHLAAKSELRRLNPVHPFLDAQVCVKASNMHIQDAMRYRLSAPTMDWDDKTDTGTVRLVFVDGDGHHELMGYAFSEKALYLHQSYILDNIVAEFGRMIAEQITTCITKR